METINERIDLLIKQLKMNKNSFSNHIGLSNSTTISNIIGGRKSFPSFDILEKIILSIDGINIEWLMIGKGQMFKEKSQIDTKNIQIQEEQEKYYNCDNCKHKQQIINTQNQRIEDLNKLLDSKNEIIEMLKSSLK